MDGSGISSRFASEKSIQEAQERRKEEWTKAYERMGQKPPEQGPPEKYDPRSLYEKLQEQKDLKQAEFDSKYSIRNQFRALDEDETSFLDTVLDEKQLAERERQAEIDAELAKFRQAVTEKQAIPEGSPPAGSPPIAGPSTTTAKAAPAAATTTTKAAPPPKSKKFQQKGLLAGAIKRKSSGGEKDKKKPTVAAEPSKADKAGGTVEVKEATEQSEVVKNDSSTGAQTTDLTGETAAKKRRTD